jgi:hypothetical protein
MNSLIETTFVREHEHLIISFQLLHAFDVERNKTDAECSFSMWIYILLE